MNYYQRAVRYLGRKKAKSLLLFSVLLVISTLILISVVVLGAVEDSKREIQEKTNANVFLDIKDEQNKITKEEVRQVLGLDNVSRVNRVANGEAYPSDFAFVTGSDSEEEENQKVRLMAYDDTEYDSAFAEQKYRLLEGETLGDDKENAVIINFLLAEINELNVGDEIMLEAPDGTVISATIKGIFSSGAERQQDDGISALYRTENQIFINYSAYEELLGEAEFYALSVYASLPEQLNSLEAELDELLGEKTGLISSDTLYRQLKAPLEQVSGIMKLMLGMTAVTACVIVTLLLCMWMKARQKEFAVFISIGEAKSVLFAQAVLETFLLFLPALGGAVLLLLSFSGMVQERLAAMSDLETELILTVRPVSVFLLTATGSAILLMAVVVSIAPILKTNPKDILGRMDS